MKLVLDTNVLIAALVARGTCSDLLEHCVRQHVVVSSQSLLNELREVLERKFRQRAIDVRAALQLFAETFAVVTPDTLDPPVCRDRDDDVVLATAVSISQLRKRRPKPSGLLRRRFLPAFGVILFYCVLSVFGDESRSYTLAVHFKYLASLFFLHY